MILSGDEVLRTQRGNNNAYCQDKPNQLVRLESHREKHRDVPVRAIADRFFRRRQPNVRRGSFLTGKAVKPNQLPDVSWYVPTANRSTGTPTGRA